jgi:hypothetical protein
LIALESEVVGAGEEEEGGRIYGSHGRYPSSLSSLLSLSERFCDADAKLAPFLFFLSLYTFVCRFHWAPGREIAGIWSPAMVKLMQFFLRGPAEAGEDERLLKDLPGSSDKEGELRSVLDGLSFPHFCGLQALLYLFFLDFALFLLHGNVYLCWVCSWKRMSSFSFLILNFIYGSLEFDDASSTSHFDFFLEERWLVSGLRFWSNSKQ